MIELEGVTVDFRSSSEQTRALSALSLAVTPSEFVLLHGASGSGKSTLLNVIAGLQRVTVGSVRVDGIDVTRASEKTLAQMRLNNVGVVFQENNLIPELTALENVEFPLRARSLDRHAAKAEAAHVLDLVSIGDLGHRRPKQLSGGQKQRVGIARAIAGGKRYLLADEPTGALDSSTSTVIFRLMRRLADDGYGIVVASHDPRAEQWADRTIRLQDGEILTYEDERRNEAAARVL